MLQSQTLNSKDFTTTDINLYYQRLIELATKQRVAFEQKISKQPQYTHYRLDFKDTPCSIKNNQIKMDSKLLVTIPNHQSSMDFPSTKVFGLLTDKCQKEDIPVSIDCDVETIKQLKKVILPHSLLLNSPIEKEPNRSYIPCFSLGTKRLFKYSNKFLIQDGNEEIELNFQSTKNLFSLTFEEFIHSITNTSLPEITFNNKEVIKFLLRSNSIQDEIQLTLLTKLVLDLPNIKTLTEWNDYLNGHKSFNLLPKIFLEALTKAGTNINPIFFTYYDFIKTYFNHQKRAI